MTNSTKQLIFSILSTALISFIIHYENVTAVDGDHKKFTLEPTVVVEMTNTIKFTPDTVQIQAGDTVRWENTSMVVHSVTGDPSLEMVQGSAEIPDQADTFNSGMMDPDESYEHVFNVPGTYKYFCIPHEGTKMYGWVIVE